MILCIRSKNFVTFARTALIKILVKVCITVLIRTEKMLYCLKVFSLEVSFNYLKGCTNVIKTHKKRINMYHMK